MGQRGRWAPGTMLRPGTGQSQDAIDEDHIADYFGGDAAIAALFLAVLRNDAAPSGAQLVVGVRVRWAARARAPCLPCLPCPPCPPCCL